MTGTIDRRRADQLLDERTKLMGSFGYGPFHDGKTRDRVLAIDIELFEGGVLGVDPRNPRPDGVTQVEPELFADVRPPWDRHEAFMTEDSLKPEARLRLLIGQPRRVSFFGLVKSTLRHFGRLYLHIDVVENSEGKVVMAIPVFAGRQRPGFMRSKEDVAGLSDVAEL